MIIYFLKNLRVLGIGLENVIWFFVKRKILECKNINCILIVLFYCEWLVILYWVYFEIKFKY